MRALKFLREGRVAPFSRLRWPVGEWVDSADQAACSAGIHACEAADLPFWLVEELWEVELGGAVTRGRHKLVAERGRLVRRVEEWNEAVGDEFREACVIRLRDFAAARPEAAGHLGDLAGWAPHVRPSAAASLTARAFEAVAGREGYDAERRAQSAWLVERLSLRFCPRV